MRLLHLADLHLGKRHDTVDLTEDQRDALTQILRAAETEKPDAVLIAGDVYDRAVPPAEAVTLFDDFLTRMAALAPVLMIPGNHDSAERLSFASRLLEKQGVYVGSGLTRVREPLMLGDTAFVLLPYLHPARMREETGRDDLHTMEEAVRAALCLVPETPGKRRVLLAHLFATAGGALPERSDSEVQPVGGLDEVDVSALDGFDYVALGHLHGAQRMGRDTVRYAGSPLPYSFSEACQHKSVALVEVGAETTVRLVPITPLHAMRQLRGNLEELLAPDFDTGAHTDYLHAVLTDGEPQLNAKARLEQVYPNLLKVTYELPPLRMEGVSAAELTQRRGRDDAALFDGFFEGKWRRTMDEEEKKIVTELLKKAGGENE